MRIKKTYTGKLPLFREAPQGSIFGPLLFNIYINELALIIDSYLESVLYADDTTLYDDDLSYNSLIYLFKHIFIEFNYKVKNLYFI